MFVTCQAYWELFSLEFPMIRENFAAVYEKVRRTRLHTQLRKPISPIEISHALDLAAALYFKQTLCLQRSAAVATLLKKYGYPAEMVVGVQQMPFLAHAWVELDGRVINDKPYMSEIYSVLSRC